MQITTEDYKKVIIRKPTDEEQRTAKIVTSDYAISCVTIHSSILNLLGLVDKVYRSKECVIKYSNKRQITSAKKALNNITKAFPKNYTTEKAWNFSDECNKNKNFIHFIQDTQSKSWKGMIIPTFVKDFKTPNSFIRAEKYGRTWQSLCSLEVLEGMSDYFNDQITLSQFKEKAEKYFDKIACDSVKGHTQTVIWEKAYKSQLKLEEELGKNFTPKQLACILPISNLNEIEKLWGIRLENYEGSWSELCNYLYSPTIISAIRNSLGVEVRSRVKGDVRKGVEINDKKRYENAIANYEKLLGCSVDNFSIKDEEKKIEDAKTQIAKLQLQYSEALIAKSFAKKNKSADYEELTKATNSIRNKLNYLKSNLSKAQNTLPKKLSAYETVQQFIKKNNELSEFIESTRTWEELCELEENNLANAIQRQKNERNIPYYTWRFVCDRIDKDTAIKIEDALEENLNKGSGVNGEDGYINVTSFPMSKSYEFFVDYPKSSNMFKAFKKKGKELSKILIEGVAQHLGIKFVCCDGETFVNNPMEKTMSGDMLDWIGV